MQISSSLTEVQAISLTGRLFQFVDGGAKYSEFGQATRLLLSLRKSARWCTVWLV